MKNTKGKLIKNKKDGEQRYNMSTRTHGAKQVWNNKNMRTQKGHMEHETPAVQKEHLDIYSTLYSP